MVIQERRQLEQGRMKHRGKERHLGTIGALGFNGDIGVQWEHWSTMGVCLLGEEEEEGTFGNTQKVKKRSGGDRQTGKK